MQKLVLLIVLGVALAGCAGNQTTTTPTPTGSPSPSPSPVVSPTANVTPTTAVTPTPTPTPTPDVTPTPTPDVTPTPTPTLPDCPEGEATTDSPGEAFGYPEIVYSVKEPAGEDDPCFAFVGPSSVAAGWTVVTLRNTGFEPHIMPMYRLDAGYDLEDFETAMMAQMGGAPEPAWATPVGGVGIATPFSQGSVVMDLQEGTYVLVCFFGGHHVQGMVRELTVTAAAGTPLAAPTANYTITMNDFNYTVGSDITAGLHIVQFINAGTQPHEGPLVQLHENTTMHEFLDAVETGQGPPPGSGIGGVNVVAPGASAFAIVNFVPGNYGLVCFVSSPEHGGAPHLALGMVAEFNVA